MPINAKILQNTVRNYKDYFKYLCDRGIIETDNWYIPGVKSTGYKFPFYWRRLKAVEIKSKSVTSAIMQENKWEAETNIIIVDEAHHAAANTYSKVIKNLDPKYLLGLTATPYRGDERDVMQIFGDPRINALEWDYPVR